MRIGNRLSVGVRLLCIVALLSLNFAHSLTPVTHADTSGAQSLSHLDNLSQSQMEALFASQICSDSHGEDESLITAPSNHNDQGCHDSVPCHACRIGGAILPLPGGNQIAEITLLTFEYLRPLKSVAFGTYFVKTNASPRSPPPWLFT